MRRQIYLLIAIVSLITLPTHTTHAQDDEAAWILAQINSVRQRNGLGALAVNAQLTAAANSHSNYLSTHPFNDAHREANGSTPSSRAWNAGYPGRLVGENVVGGSLATREWAIQWWLNSPVHYNNILAGWTEVGVGVVSGSYGKFYTTVFGTQGEGLVQPTSPPAPPAAENNNAAPAPAQNTGNTNPPAPPAPTRRPATRVPTDTPTITLTPSQTFTLRPTFTPTDTPTGRPPTETPIILGISTQVIEPTLTETATIFPTLDVASSGIVAVAMITTPNPLPAAPKMPANDGFRGLIPWLLVLGLGVVGGSVVSSGWRRRH